MKIVDQRQPAEDELHASISGIPAVRDERHSLLKRGAQSMRGPDPLAIMLQLGSTSAVLRLDAVQTVDELYREAERSLLVLPGSYRVVFGGRELSDRSRQISSYRLYNGCTLQLLQRNVGGSAAARAQMAMKRKKERKEMMAFLQASDSSEDEPDDFKFSQERVTEMMSNNVELHGLMDLKMAEFMDYLTEALENPGESQEQLEALEEAFDKLLYNGFIKGKGFYALGHRTADAVARAFEESVIDEEKSELPGWAVPFKRVVDAPPFKNFIVICICIAGVIVGTNTYLDCGEVQSCYSAVDASTMWAEQECLTGSNWTEDDCRRAKCCFEPATGDSTSHCWARGGMPECLDGDTAESLSGIFEFVDTIILYIFTFECAVTILSNGTKPWRYFANPWNTFDFLIVCACYMPAGGDVAVLRLMRLMRLLKLLHTVENLQIILHGLAAGFGSISYILILMLLVYYLFAIMAIMVFKANDSVHFQDLDTAMITLFRVATMEDWTDVMYINMFGCDKYGYGSYCYEPASCAEGGCEPCETMCQTPEAWGYTAAIFFIVFVVIAGFVVMSLFIGVITTSMGEAQDQHTQQKRAGKQLIAKDKLRAELEQREEAGIYYRPSDAEGDEGGSDSDSDSDEEQAEHVQHSNPLVDKYVNLGEFCAWFVNKKAFGNFITGCILVAATLIGMQTYPGYGEGEEYGGLMIFMDEIILGIFTLEIILKLIAAQLRPWTFFHERWNVFDFVVVAVCFMPFGGSMVAVLRLLRLLRVLKLLKALPQLQIIMSGLAQGMASIGYIALLLILLFYVMGIMAIMFFRDNDPLHFGTLHGTFVTLFRCSTFEDWTDVMYIAMYGCQMWSYGTLDERCENSSAWGLWGAAYFLTFILFSALIMLNLVIGSICSSMGDAQEAYEVAQRRKENIAKVVEDTKIRGKEYGITGISFKCVDAWITAFNRMDSASSALALEASIHKNDLDTVLQFIGETDTLTKKSLEMMRIRANHTLPIGLIDMQSFVESTANDLMSKRIKELSQTTGYVVIESVSGLMLDDEGLIIDALDPCIAVIVNGTQVGKTHKITHSGQKPDWHERVSFPTQLIKPTKNVIVLECFDYSKGTKHDILGSLTIISTEGLAKMAVVDEKGNPRMDFQVRCNSIHMHPV
eukprot:COSAG05_NODE_181_length_14767_cov_9.554859_1_plen_1146_part_00